MKLGVASAVLAGLTAVSAVAAGDPPGLEDPYAEDSQPSREALIAEGKALGARGSWRDALEKFTQAAEIQVDPRVLIFMGWAEENLGRLVVAKAHYQQARGDARAAKLPREERYAEEALAGLQPRIPRVALRIPAGIAAAVMIDGRPVDPPAQSTEVDPGVHVVTATAVGRQPFRLEIKLDPGGEEVVEVALRSNLALRELPPRPVAPPTRRSNVGAAVVGVLGFAAAAGGTVALVAGLDRTKPSEPLQGLGIGMMVVGAGAGLGAIVWTVSSSGARLDVAVAPVRGGAFGGVSGVF